MHGTDTGYLQICSLGTDLQISPSYQWTSETLAIAPRGKVSSRLSKPGLRCQIAHKVFKNYIYCMLNSYCNKMLLIYYYNSIIKGSVYIHMFKYL